MAVAAWLMLDIATNVSAIKQGFIVNTLEFNTLSFDINSFHGRFLTTHCLDITVPVINLLILT
tara:strand:+ start:15876 stop:16064 length:189 start_codon:yes stop_codon:yes gene_type:complete